ncbi:MAG: glycerophosphodiester phosphodiesterase [Tannerella sp.]|jgi:glycerophosphoryl diester phosphodiesterase|nr:glycerophosphodiester phosphodiesterase [Tannerella sp.]
MKSVFLGSVAGLFFCLSAVAQDKTQVIAHRGYWQSKGSAQNSITALENANRIRVYGSEFDVHLTADGIPVIFHDNKINEIEIQAVPYSTLKDMSLPNGERIPTLREFLEAAKHAENIRLIFELKPHATPERNREAARVSVELVKEKKLQHRTEYITFNQDAGNELIRLAPDADVYYLNGDLSPQELKELGYAGLDYHYNVMKEHPDWFKEAKKLGLGINVWTVNDTTLMRTISDSGADFITTDIPNDALNYFSNK